jgi:hypothetical protein
MDNPKKEPISMGDWERKENLYNFIRVKLNPPAGGAGPQPSKAERGFLEGVKAQMDLHAQLAQDDVDWWYDFYGWLIGKGTNADHAKTPWGRTPLTGPGIVDFVRSFYRAMMSFKAKWEELKMGIPDDPRKSFLYFKYIVRGKEPHDIENLEDLRWFYNPVGDDEDSATNPANRPGVYRDWIATHNTPWNEDDRDAEIHPDTAVRDPWRPPNQLFADTIAPGEATRGKLQRAAAGPGPGQPRVDKAELDVAHSLAIQNAELEAGGGVPVGDIGGAVPAAPAPPAAPSGLPLPEDIPSRSEVRSRSQSGTTPEDLPDLPGTPLADVVAEQVAEAEAEERPQTREELLERLGEIDSGNVVGLSKLIDDANRLGDTGLAERLTRLLEMYSRTGALTRWRLEEIAEAQRELATYIADAEPSLSPAPPSPTSPISPLELTQPEAPSSQSTSSTTPSTSSSSATPSSSSSESTPSARTVQRHFTEAEHMGADAILTTPQDEAQRVKIMKNIQRQGQHIPPTPGQLGTPLGSGEGGSSDEEHAREGRVAHTMALYAHGESPPPPHPRVGEPAPSVAALAEDPAPVLEQMARLPTNEYPEEDRPLIRRVRRIAHTLSVRLLTMVRRKLARNEQPSAGSLQALSMAGLGFAIQLRGMQADTRHPDTREILGTMTGWAQALGQHARDAQIARMNGRNITPWFEEFVPQLPEED